MKTGIILLVIIALFSIIGTVIPQGNIENFYSENYSNFFANMILALDFDKVFSSWWYILLSLLLLINLFLCSVNRFKPIIKKSFTDPDLYKKANSYKTWIKVRKDEDIFKKFGIKDPKKI